MVKVNFNGEPTNAVHVRPAARPLKHCRQYRVSGMSVANLAFRISLTFPFNILRHNAIYHLVGQRLSFWTVYVGAFFHVFVLNRSATTTVVNVNLDDSERFFLYALLNLMRLIGVYAEK